MINPKELRLGNYIYAELVDCPRRIVISAISSGGVSEYGSLAEPTNPQSTYERKWISIDDLKPIPLTEEILLKSGFEKHKFGIVTYYHPLFELDNNFRIKGIDYNRKIEYLHELQNIFYDLTGNEIDICF
ncbi:MAG: hypothetical protein EGP82_00200 [Odoribacter splanchnicus]|nr:hypothetical protein [Odoribacter splanchnicus]